jgi:oligosaccharide repeat unit polymerase
VFDTDVFSKLLALMFSFGILLAALAFKEKTKSWSSPPVVFAAFWFLFTFIPLIGMFDTPINPFSVLFILGCVIAFGSTCIFFPWEKAKILNMQNAKLDENMYSGQVLSSCFYVIQISVVGCILMNLSIQGYSPDEFIFDLFGTANRYLVARYEGRIEPNIFSQIGVVFNYTGVCIGGLIISSRKSNFRKLLVIAYSFIPSALHMLIYADKGTLFLCASLFYGGVIVARTMLGDTSLTNKTTNRIVFIAFLVLIPILFASFMARGIGGGTSAETTEKLKFYMNSYAFGHLYAFSDWFSSITTGVTRATYRNVGDYTYGLYTFMAPFKFFGDTTYIPDGYYDEYYNYNDLIQSNIFTIFRGLIQDFSMGGAIAFMAYAGLLFNFTYYRLLTIKKPIFSAAMYICMAGFIYSSFLISIMVWNSIFAIYIAVSLLLFANNIFYQGESRTNNTKSPL